MQPITNLPCMPKDDPFKYPFVLTLLSSISSPHLPNQFTLIITSLPQTMANTSLHPLHHHTASSRRRRHSLDSSSPPPIPSSLFLKPIKKTTTFPTFTFSLPSSTSTTTATATSSAAATATTNPPIPFDVLQQHLAAQNFREADEETRRLLIQLAGEAAQKRKYVFFSEVQFISKEDLQAIDALWRQHSNNRYGYSVQRKIWKKLNRDFTKFFVKVGWMKKLEGSEVVQYNYKAFPDEFFWEMTDDTPEGHLPLTNALRGTQLMTYILDHPAFVEMEEQEEKDGGGGGYNGNISSSEVKEEAKSTLGKGLFKPNYSF